MKVSALLVSCFLLCVLGREVTLPYSYPQLAGQTSWRVGLSEPVGFTLNQFNYDSAEDTTSLHLFYESHAFFAPLGEKTGTRISSGSSLGEDEILREAEYFFPLNYGATARYINRITNLSGNPVSINLVFGVLEETATVLTSSGGDELAPGDFWFITTEEISGRYILHFLGQEGAIPISESASEVVDDDSLRITWNTALTLEDEGVAEIMYFAHITETLEEAMAAVAIFDVAKLPAELTSGLSVADLDNIVNEVEEPEENDEVTPSAVAFSNLCQIASEVRDRTSSSRGHNSKHQFNKPWFC